VPLLVRLGVLPELLAGFDDVGGLADSAGFRSIHSQRSAASNAPDRMLWMM
jgi:hypothetical protein